jgi:hypothetical protein
MHGLSEQRPDIARARRSWPFEEHEEVEYHLGVLELLIVSSTAVETKTWTDRLCAWFRVAGPRIERHLRREESSELYTSFVDQFPRFGLRMKELLAEHGVIAENIRTARNLMTEGPTLDLIARLREVISSIKRHERAENEIVERAYWEDLGGVD